MKVERLVVDTNVLITAVLRPQGPPRIVFNAVRSANGVLVFSRETYIELHDRLFHSKFDRYVTRNIRAVWLTQLLEVSELVSIIGARMGCCNPDDDKLLETALIGDAAYLITGDQDLLTMAPQRRFEISTPNAYIERLVE